LPLLGIKHTKDVDCIGKENGAVMMIIDNINSELVSWALNNTYVKNQMDTSWLENYS